jgi:hypothetical protein
MVFPEPLFIGAERVELDEQTIFHKYIIKKKEKKVYIGNKVATEMSDI